MSYGMVARPSARRQVLQGSCCARKRTEFNTFYLLPLTSYLKRVACKPFWV